MGEAAALAAGREAFRASHWSDAARLLAEAEEREPLGPADYAALATSRVLMSPDQLGPDIWADAHRVLAERGDPAGAARAAYWAAVTLWRLGEQARGFGWIERGRRLLDEWNLDCVERGYLLIPSMIAAGRAGDTATQRGLIAEIRAIARRFGDHDLLTFIRHAEARSLLYQGDVAEGMAIVDETMLTVTTAGVSPLIAGTIFCSLVEALATLWDLSRAREWTALMERWCRQQSDLDVFRGECQVYRAQVLEVGGDWRHAAEQAALACRSFLGPPRHPAAGLAFYQQGELHRLAGRFPEAEFAFAKAAEFGRNPQPGLALLRLAQGREDAAAAAIRRALAETPDPRSRAGLLPAAIEVLLARDEVEAAGAVATELAAVAERLGSDYLAGLAAKAEGAVLRASGEAEQALPVLRRAADTWQRLDAPYQAAQTRVLIGQACRDLGDEDAATLEIDGARRAFDRLGAAPDSRRTSALLSTGEPVRPGGLTAREVELLELLATGLSNREIAAELVISERTVARHVSNIFTKLGVSSRAGATAWALKGGLG